MPGNAIRRRLDRRRASGRTRQGPSIDGASAVNGIQPLGDQSVATHAATVSVVIPVKNAGSGFARLLATLRRQRGFADLEIVVVDSGSTDGSLEVAEQHGARVICIAPQDFSHSRARNLGAEQARGAYLLFTVQDALPPSDEWLQELFRVLQANDVVAVSCTEFPRADADLFYRAISWNHYRMMQVEQRDRIMTIPGDDSYLAVRQSGQLSNIACLISGKVFREYQFRGNYAEDLDLGIRLIKHGYKFAFVSSTRIIHSHNRPASYYLKRGYVDELVISELFPARGVARLDPERLCRDMVFTNNVVHSVLYHELGRFRLPCSLGTLIGVVRQRFRRARSDGYAAGLAIGGNGHVDAEFTRFLRKIQMRPRARAADLVYDGTLLGQMEGHTDGLFGYMETVYETVDETVLEEFRIALYKLFALVCGGSLGSCFFAGDEGVKEKLQDIHQELCDGV